MLSPMDMMIDSRLLGGLPFLAAGLYQFTPVKLACLRFCRSPLDFVLNHWRNGSGGALRMDLTHGLYCLGCCWILMLLLFVSGVMNLLWVAALSAIVEKLMAGPWIGRIGGVLPAACGVCLLVMGQASRWTREIFHKFAFGAYHCSQVVTAFGNRSSNRDAMAMEVP